MLLVSQITPPYRYLALIMATTIAMPGQTEMAHEPARVNFLFIQSVQKCLHNGENPNIFTPTRNLSGFTQTTPRDCKSVFRHFLMNFRSYVSVLSPHHSHSVPSDTIMIHRPLDVEKILSHFGLNQDDLCQIRMTKMWATLNEILKSSVLKNMIHCRQNAKPVVHSKNRNEVLSDNGFWGALLKRSQYLTSEAPPTPIKVEKIKRRRRDDEHEDIAGSGLGDVASSRGAGSESRAALQKREYGGSWYDLIRNRRQQVLSVNNAMATLSDMLMEHHRNRILRNRERLRYYMTLAG